jgi:hypothetical protein
MKVIQVLDCGVCYEVAGDLAICFICNFSMLRKDAPTRRLLEIAFGMP